MKKIRKTLSASSLASDHIYNYKEKKIGDIKDIMINLKEGTVEYVVVAFGGLLGFGDKYFAIPWSLFHVDEEHKCMRLNLDEKKLKEMPGFDKDHWPDELTQDEVDQWKKLAKESIREAVQA